MTNAETIRALLDTQPYRVSAAQRAQLLALAAALEQITRADVWSG